MGDTIHLMKVYTKTTAKAWFQYRVDALLKSLAVFLRESTSIIVIYFTLLKFDTLSGWNIYEMLFLCSLIFMTYGIMIIFFTGLRDFGKTVRDGSFDRFLLRPRGLLFQILFANADWFASLGQGGLGVALFIVSAGKVGVSWNAQNICYYAITVAGGVLIQGAVFLILAALNIYLLQTDSFKELLYWNTRRFAAYPISIFNNDICDAICIRKLLPGTVSAQKERYEAVPGDIYVPDTDSRCGAVSAGVRLLEVFDTFLQEFR